MASRSIRKSRTAQLLSTTLFVVAIGFAAAAIYIWYTDDSTDGPGPPPTADSPGEIELVHVLGVLDETNDDWDYGRNPSSVRTDQIPMPGQHLVLGDAHLYVFIFTGSSGEARIAAREEASARVDPDTMVLKTTTDTALTTPGETFFMSAHSNVITVLVGGDEALARQVDQALVQLP